MVLNIQNIKNILRATQLQIIFISQKYLENKKQARSKRK